MPKNYYIILVIPFNSTHDYIKAAYRRLAKEYHPDHYGENHTPFQAIHEAYSVRGDPSSRRNYDSHLKDRLSEPLRQGPTLKVDPSEVVVEPLIPEADAGVSGVRSLDRSIHRYSNVFDGFFDNSQLLFLYSYFLYFTPYPT